MNIAFVLFVVLVVFIVFIVLPYHQMIRGRLWADKNPASIRFKIFRWVNHVYASTGGYFWKPCPICGMWFGGHEIGNVFLITEIKAGARSGHAICYKPDCRYQAAHRNIEFESNQGHLYKGLENSIGVEHPQYDTDFGDQ